MRGHRHSRSVAKLSRFASDSRFAKVRMQPPACAKLRGAQNPADNHDYSTYWSCQVDGTLNALSMSKR
jgi:hypothetical protein